MESVSLCLWSPQKLRNEVPPKSEGASSDEDDEDDVGTAVSSRASDMREERATDVDVLIAGSRDVELRPRKSKKKTSSKPQPPLEENDDLSEREVESAVSPIKIGPPRGPKRQEVSKEATRSAIQISV